MIISDSIDKEYNVLCKLLKEMQEEYKYAPSKFLEKKINLVYNKLKNIDRMIIKRS